MDKDYFLNHEILGDDPLLFLAFFGFTNIEHKYNGKENKSKEIDDKKQKNIQDFKKSL